MSYNITGIKYIGPGKLRPWTARDAEEVSERADEWAKNWSDKHAQD